MNASNLGSTYMWHVVLQCPVVYKKGWLLSNLQGLTLMAVFTLVITLSGFLCLDERKKLGDYGYQW